MYRNVEAQHVLQLPVVGIAYSFDEPVLCNGRKNQATRYSSTAVQQFYQSKIWLKQELATTTFVLKVSPHDAPLEGESLRRISEVFEASAVGE